MDERVTYVIPEEVDQLLSAWNPFLTSILSGKIKNLK